MMDAVRSGQWEPSLEDPRRKIIAWSHQRLTRQGFDRTRNADVPHLGFAALEKRRRESDLTDLKTMLWDALRYSDDSQFMTVHDPAGWVLWREGSNKALKIADKTEFVQGACWAENVVGTNAAGIAALGGIELFCIAGEHYVVSHHPYFCAAAPLRDPWDKRLLGVVNVTTRMENAHQNTLPMVVSVAKNAINEVFKPHYDRLMMLRGAAERTLSRLGALAVVTDHLGRVAAPQGLAHKHRVLPVPVEVDQPFECPQLGGWWVLDQFQDGLLWRRTAEDATPVTRVELDVRQPTRLSLTVHGTSTSRSYDLTEKFAEILFLLAWIPAGRTRAELLQDLYGGAATDNAVSVLVRRTKKHCGELLDSQPYRFKDHLDVSVHMPDDLSDLLPFSDAPAICRIRSGAAI